MSFAGGSFGVFLLASAVSAFMAAQTASSSFQVLCVLSLVATGLLLVGFALGAVVVRRLPGRAYAAAVGAGGAIVFVAVLAVAAALNANPVEWWGLVVLLPVLGGVSSLLQRNKGA
jgi:hypothetical protein